VKKIKLEIIALSYSQTQSGAYALVLGEANGKRRLPVIIGGYEAQAIAIQIENMKPSRPLTHDLMKTFAESFNIVITEVIIYKIVEGIFYAKLVANNVQQTIEIDARTSDGIAMALRFDCPIYTYESILSTYGVVLDDENNKLENIGDASLEVEENKNDLLGLNDFSHINTEDLQMLLQTALEEEDYEKASRIRDELNDRQ
jgi:bifunctional DNase/RNase